MPLEQSAGRPGERAVVPAGQRDRETEIDREPSIASGGYEGRNGQPVEVCRRVRGAEGRSSAAALGAPGGSQCSCASTRDPARARCDAGLAGMEGEMQELDAMIRATSSELSELQEQCRSLEERVLVRGGGQANAAED